MNREAEVGNNLVEFGGKSPRISPKAFVHPKALVIGDVEIGDYSSIWANVVIRGDDAKITIGSRTNVQENTVIHTPYDHRVTIGDDVTIAHGCIIHGCELEDLVCVSIGGAVFDGASIGKGAIVDSKAFVYEGMRIPPRTLVHGNPGRPVRVLTDREQTKIKLWARWYVEKVKRILALEERTRD